MFLLKLLGGACLTTAEGPVVGSAGQRQSLALLAVLAVHARRGITRERLATLLWSEANEEQASRRLKQAVYVLRRELGRGAIRGTIELRLGLDVVACDLVEFERTFGTGELELAVGHYAGPFLDGFHLAGGSKQFENWVDSERERLARGWRGAVQTLAEKARARGDHIEALTRWRQLAAVEPLSGRWAREVADSLAAVGDHAAALRHLVSHHGLLRDELGLPPGPELEALEARLRTASAIAALLPQPTADASPNEQSLASAHDPVAASQMTSPAQAPEGDSRLGTRSSALSASGRAPRSAFLRAAVGAAALIAAITIAGLVDRDRIRHHDAPILSERRVAVTPFRNETGDTALASVGRALVDWVVQGLVQTQLVEVVAPGVREAELPASVDSARTLSAGLILRGSYWRVADSLVVQAQVVSASTGRVVRAVGPVAAPVGEPLIALEGLRQRLIGALATRVDRRLSRWADAAAQPTSFEAYRALDDGMSEFFSSDDSSYEKAGRLLVHAAALDSNFNLPLLWALYAFSNSRDRVRLDSVLRVLAARHERLSPFDRALLDTHTAQLRGDATEAYNALRRVVAIAPNSEWVCKLAGAALDLRRLTEADSLLGAVDPDVGWIRDWRGYWQLRTDVAYSLGRHDVELDAASLWDQRFGVDVEQRRIRGRALAAQGRSREVLALVDDAIRQSPRGLDLESLFRMVSAARVHGHIELARALAQRALRASTSGEGILSDSAMPRARYRLLVLESAEQWDEATDAATQLIRQDSITRHRDALPYLVLLEAALNRGAGDDTASLEAHALSEAAASPKSDDANDNWISSSLLAVRAELAAVHGDVRGTRALIQEAAQRGVFDYYFFSEQPAFDQLRANPSFSNFVHQPSLERPRSVPLR